MKINESLAAENESLRAEVVKGIEKVYRLGEVIKMQKVAHRARRDLMRQHRKSAAVLLEHVKALSAENERLKAELRLYEA